MHNIGGVSMHTKVSHSHTKHVISKRPTIGIQQLSTIFRSSLDSVKIIYIPSLKFAVLWVTISRSFSIFPPRNSKRSPFFESTTWIEWKALSKNFDLCNLWKKVRRISWQDNNSAQKRGVINPTEIQTEAQLLYFIEKSWLSCLYTLADKSLLLGSHVKDYQGNSSRRFWDVVHSFVLTSN